MNNYFRAIRLTFRYKYSILASILCALLVGVLWGGNITVLVYPIVDVCFKKETFVDWIDRKIMENDLQLQELREEIGVLKKDVVESEDPVVRKFAKKKLSRQQSSLWWYELYHSFFLKAKPYVERYAPGTPFGTMGLIIVFALVGTALKTGFTIVQSILAAHIAQSAANRIRQEFFNKVIQYDVNHFSREGIAGIMTRFTSDVHSLVSGLGTLYGKLVREPLKMITCLTAAAFISWQLLLLTLLLVPVAAYLIRWLARSLKRAARRSMEELTNMFGRLEESFRSIRVVKAFCREGLEKGKFRQTNNALYAKWMKVAKYDALTNPTTEVLGVLMICIAVLAGSYLVMNERTDIFGIPMTTTPLSQPVLLVFFGLLAGASDPARKLSDIFTQFQTAAAAADRVFEMIDRPIEIVNPPVPVPFGRHKQSIVFEHVCFEYEKNRPVVRDVSLEIRFGETIAIIGPSGCGKSSLLNLVPRFADPTGGEIRIDGIPIKNCRLRNLRHQIGLVTQEPFLFNDTVVNNIKYGVPLASEDEVIEAAKNAFAHDFIIGELAQGYETPIGPGGGQLSGGQRQRIALARAFLTDPSIFLLDEATSQIDLLSEQMIHKALEKFIGNRTTILVTHRLSALILADRIVVMKDGEIESIGTHKELLENSPFYKRLQQIESL